MASRTDLAINIHKQLSDDARKEIIRKCWRISLSERDLHDTFHNYDFYFDNYERLCQQCSVNDLGMLRHCDILDAFDRILLHSRAESALQLKDLALTYAAPFNVPKDIDDFVKQWIRFTAESLLLVDVSAWSSTQTFQDFLETQQFCVSTQDEEGYLPRKFHARNLNKIGGIQIRWTNLLSEHLMLEADNTQVAIFHQVNALDLLIHRGLFPAGLLEETRQTLGILLPRFSPKTTKWFRHETSRKWWRRLQKTDLHVDSASAATKSLTNEQRKIASFKYFRDRLIVLKEEYDAHEPQSIKEYWHDYRKPAQWWAFWVAVVVFMFGITYVIEGAIQCYKAYHPS